MWRRPPPVTRHPSGRCLVPSSPSPIQSFKFHLISKPPNSKFSTRLMKLSLHESLFSDFYGKQPLYAVLPICSSMTPARLASSNAAKIRYIHFLMGMVRSTAAAANGTTPRFACSGRSGVSRASGENVPSWPFEWCICVGAPLRVVRGCQAAVF